MKTAILSTDFLISAANDTSDDWHRVCSYGDFPNRAGMQRIDKTAAQQMAASFSGAAARLINWISGGAHTLPAYLGHPDEPAFANTQGHDDTTRYADIDAVEARDDGIYCHFKWSAAWAGLKAKMPRLYISPRWAMTETARGSGIYSPRKLLSIGLTPTPNLPFASAVNTDEPEQNTTNTMKKDKLLELLKLLGQTVAAEATDEQINTALEAAIAAATKAAADKKAKDDELAAAKADKTAANTALSAANAATAKERTARASDVVTRAIQAGKITAAERAAHEATLIAADDFTSAANALLAEKTVVKTAATVTGVDQRNTVADASAKFESAVNSRMTATGEDRNTAYQTFAGTSEGKALMEQMKKPAA